MVINEANFITEVEESRKVKRSNNYFSLSLIGVCSLNLRDNIYIILLYILKTISFILVK